MFMFAIFSIVLYFNTLKTDKKVSKFADLFKPRKKAFPVEIDKDTFERLSLEFGRLNALQVLVLLQNVIGEDIAAEVIITSRGIEIHSFGKTFNYNVEKEQITG